MAWVWPPKYGIRDPDNPDHSGFTPTDTEFPRLVLNPQAHELDDRELYQETKLQKFTVRELITLDAITSRKLKPGNLTVDVHPILERDNWERTPWHQHTRRHMYNLIDGSGVWSAWDDRVWEVLRPILQIATCLLNNASQTSWFMGVFGSEYHKVDPKRFRPTGKSPTLCAKPPKVLTKQLSDATNKIMEDIFRRMISPLSETTSGYHLEIRFKHPSESPQDCTLEESSGLTWTSQVGKIFVSISYGPLVALMRDDLTDMEIMCVQWQVANTILHEIVHGMWIVHSQILYNGTFYEPVWMNDAISELGFSMEHNVFGGIPLPMRSSVNGEANLGCFIGTIWPSYSMITCAEQSYILISPPLYDTQEFYPLKASCYEDIQQMEFWRAGLPLFGMKIIHFRSLGVGTRYILRTLLDNTQPAGGEKIEATHSYRMDTPLHKLAELRQLMELELKKQSYAVLPMNRSLVKFGRKLINNDIWNSNFWLKASVMSQYITDMLAVLEKLRDPALATTGLRAKITQQLLRFIWNTREVHEEQVDVLLRMENDNDGQWDTDRHNDCLNWNKGARIFARSVYHLFKGIGDVKAKDAAENELYALELYNMLLFNEGDVTTVQSILDENKYIQDIYSNIQDAQQRGNVAAFASAAQIIQLHLQNCESLSLFSEARILLCESRMNSAVMGPYYDFANRHRMLDTADAMAQRLLAGCHAMVNTLVEQKRGLCASGGIYEGLLSAWVVRLRELLGDIALARVCVTVDEAAAAARDGTTDGGAM